MPDPFEVCLTDALPFGVLVGVSMPGDREPVPSEVLSRLTAEERAHAETLKGFRQPEWVAGRLALQRALRQLGRKPTAVLAGARGEPLLPKGIAASISHKRELAVALASRADDSTLGVDLEDLATPREGIAERVLRPEELEAVHAVPPENQWAATVIRFAVKEAVYKAIFPYVRRFVGFEEARVEPDVDGTAAVTLLLTGGEGPFRLQARYHWLPGRVLAAVRLRPE